MVTEKDLVDKILRGETVTDDDIEEMLSPYLQYQNINGSTGKQFRQRLLDLQGHKCLICEKESKKYVLDHDHETGRIRGMLCPACNILLGCASDDIHVLINAIRYLKMTKADLGFYGKTPRDKA